MYYNLMERKTKNHKKELKNKKREKEYVEDGQQKSHRPHTRPTTLNLRKRKKRLKLYYIILGI